MQGRNFCVCLGDMESFSILIIGIVLYDERYEGKAMVKHYFRVLRGRLVVQYDA